MRFREFARGLFRASRKLTNVYAVVQGDETILIDTGEPSFGPAILRALKPLPSVRHILLTHVHYDHVGSAARIAVETGARVHAHPAEAELLAKGQWRRSCAASPTVLGRVMKRIVADRFPDEVEPVTAHPVEGDTLESIAEVKVLPLPGHSAGQIGYGFMLSDGRTAWIVGDVIMNIAGPREPILYEDRAGGLASIGALAAEAADDDLICLGHGAPMSVTQALKAKLQALSQRK